MKKILLLSTFLFLVGSYTIFGQTQSITYHSGAADNGWKGVSTTLSNFSTCQTSVSLSGNAGMWDGVSWNVGNYNVVVNGSTIGN
ncbi:MAG: hypothetical protein HY840_08975, partial [Bacteroidetes bacterium]|nr:hypothetical protein [Bacteroidota bacterium]